MRTAAPMVIGQLLWCGLLSAATLPTTSITTPAPSTAPATLTIRFAKENFSIDAPPLPWVVQNPKLVPQGAAVGYARSWPSMGFTVIAESLGIESGTTTRDLEQIVLDNLRVAAPDAKVIAREPLRLAGLDFARVDIHATINGRRFAYRFLICCHNGFAFQMVGHTLQADEAKMHASIPPITNSFRLLDPKRIEHTADSKPFERFQSPRFGYVIDLKDPAWRQWNDSDHGEIGAKLGADSAMMVVPMAFLGDAPDLEALAPALLSLMSIEWDKVNAVSRITEDQKQGYVCSFDRDVNGERYHYRLKVLRGEGFGYLAAAWTCDPALFKSMDGWLACVTRANADPVVATIDSLTERERNIHASLLQSIGLHYYYKKEYDRVLKSFIPAISLARKIRSTATTRCSVT